MQEKYKLIDIVSYVNKDNKTIYLAVLYIVKGNITNLQKVSVSEAKAEVLEQYINQDISNILSLEYDSYNNDYKLRINVE